MLNLTCAFESAVRLNPEMKEALEYRAFCLFETEQYKAALEALEAVLERNPENLSALHKKAICFLQLRKYESGAKTLSRVLELDPGNKEAKFELGIASFESGEYDKALSLFEEVSEGSDKGSFVYCPEKNSSEQNNSKQNFSEQNNSKQNLSEQNNSKQNFSEQSISEEKYSSFYWKGLVLIRLKAYERALEVFSRLTEENPLFVEAWYLKGISHSKLKQHDKDLIFS